MLKKSISFKDVDGNPLTEDFYFNLNLTEIMDLENSVDGGLTERMQKIIDAKGENKGLEIMDTFRKIIIMSVGERSEDGRRFSKRDGEVGKEFMETDAYNELFYDLCSNAKSGAEFISSLVPAEMMERMQKAIDERPKDVELPPGEQPAWIKENRSPTPDEIKNMTQDQLRDAFARKTQPTTQS